MDRTRKMGRRVFLVASLARWRLRKAKERFEAGLKEGEKRGGIRGWEKGIEEGRRLERERVMAKLASQSNGDVDNQH